MCVCACVRVRVRDVCVYLPQWILTIVYNRLLTLTMSARCLRQQLSESFLCSLGRDNWVNIHHGRLHSKQPRSKYLGFLRLVWNIDWCVYLKLYISHLTIPSALTTSSIHIFWSFSTSSGGSMSNICLHECSSGRLLSRPYHFNRISVISLGFNMKKKR